MIEILRFFQQYEYVLYWVLGIGAIGFGTAFWKAWLELRGAIFGLEQAVAQQRLNRAAVALFVLFVIGFVVFALVTFVAPVAAPEIVLPLDVQGIVSGAELTPAVDGEAVVPTANPLSTATPLPTVVVEPEGCLAGEVEITSPKPGTAISGTITVTGTANITNFGFYKFEVARASEELWLTIQAQRSPVIDGNLVEDWDTSFFDPGEYVLQLVVTDSNGVAMAPCRVPARIGNAP